MGAEQDGNETGNVATCALSHPPSATREIVFDALNALPSSPSQHLDCGTGHPGCAATPAAFAARLAPFANDLSDHTREWLWRIQPGQPVAVW